MMARKNYGNPGAREPSVSNLQRKLAENPMPTANTPPDTPRTGIDSYMQYPAGPASISTRGLAFGREWTAKPGEPEEAYGLTPEQAKVAGIPTKR
jgi:hypothetical protein